MPAGRPSEYSDTIFNYILEQIALGRSVKSICEETDMPSRVTFYKWLDNSAELANKYAIATRSPIYKEAIRCRANIKGSRATAVDDYRTVNCRAHNKKKYPNSNIYLMKLGELNIYKIGVSQNVERRLRDVNSANPFEVILIITKPVKKAYDLEELLHEIYKGSSLQNEWFLLSESELREIINKIGLWEGK